MAIQFKFRSSVNFDSVDIDGRPSISIGDLKSKIIRMKNLNTFQNFDLVFSDARTGQDLVDEKLEIPSGSCVIIKRVPAGSVPSNVGHCDLFGNFQVKDTGMVNSSRSLNAETENFDDFGVDLYPIVKANSSISLNNKNHHAVRHNKETERGYFEPEGSDISEAVQGDLNHGTTVGGTELQMDTKVNAGEGIVLEKPVVVMTSMNHNGKIPSELKCTLCNSLFVDAVIIGCCKHSFCENCIQHVLLQKEKCPKCASTKYKLEGLLPNVSLRKNVARFLGSRIPMNDLDNVEHHDAPDEESRIEGKHIPSSSYATSRGCNQEVVEDLNDSSSRNLVNGAPFGLGHPEKFGGRPQDNSSFDDCQGENQPVFGDFKHGFLDNYSDMPGKIQDLTNFRRDKKHGRACYMCGSLDHLIRDCPVAPKPHPMHIMGATPYYALPWSHVNHVSSFTNIYGCPLTFNTPLVPEANSYWAPLYGGYPAPSGYVAPQLRKAEEFCAGYSEFIDVNDTTRKRTILDNRTKRAMPFNNEGGCEVEDGFSKKRGQHEQDGRIQKTKDERNWLYEEKRKSSHSSKDAMINRFSERLNFDTKESLPCTTKLQTKERSEQHHRCCREVGGRTDECCSHFILNHHKSCRQKEPKIKTAEADLKCHTKKHHGGSRSDLERSYPSNHKRMLQKEIGSSSRYSKHNELSRDHWHDDNREEWNPKYKRKRF